MKIKLLLVDDHALVRDGLRSLLSSDPDIGEIAEASNGMEAIKKVKEHNPNVIVMDYEMPNFNGIYATKEIIRENASNNILLVSAHHSREHIMEGINAGIRGFLPKETKIEELSAAIKALSKGETWFKGSTAELIAPSLIDSLQPQKRIRNSGALTSREKEITRLLAEGNPAKRIAEKLCISKRTVDVHKSNIFKKLGVKNISELVRHAIRHEMVKL